MNLAPQTILPQTWMWGFMIQFQDRIMLEVETSLKDDLALVDNNPPLHSNIKILKVIVEKRQISVQRDKSQFDTPDNPAIPHHPANTHAHVYMHQPKSISSKTMNIGFNFCKHKSRINELIQTSLVSWENCGILN